MNLNEHAEIQYLDIMREILALGEDSDDRTGVGTRKLFGTRIVHDFENGFPLLTTKKMHTKSIIGELIWFVSGNTNIKFLQEMGVTIWDEWADKHGNLGPVYSHQWRNFGGEHKNRKQPTPKFPLIGEKTPTVLGIALGKKSPNDIDLKLYSTWKAMIYRCYDSKRTMYDHYGQKGAFICDDWLVFDQFAIDAKKLPNWDKKFLNWEGYHLDKDTIGDGFCYSPSTCAWVTVTDNIREIFKKEYCVKNTKTNEEFLIKNQTEFAKTHNIAPWTLGKLLRGEQTKLKDWVLVSSKDTTKGVDQLLWVLNEIKKNPSSRRLVVSAWNPIDIPHMGLPPCHVLFQFNCRKNDLLDISVYQRSADWFLGVPFNIASYSFLLAMFCAQTGRKPGRLIYNFGDSHIYKNHFEQCELQISRKPFSLPSLRLADRLSIDYYQIEDFQMIDYECHPAIKAEVAV